jgi:N,N'-diacetyllegionaminate synthase
MGRMIFCAELGSNHKGIESLAFEMIRQFSEAGATICKFQLGHDRNDPIRYVDHIAPKLKEWCDYFDVEFMASIWTSSALNLAKILNMKRYKIAHQLALDPEQKELVEEIISEGKEVFMSGNIVPRENVRAIYVSPKYPTYPDMIDVPKVFTSGYWYGYSDHTHGIAAPLLAIARGAKFVEVHCTLDKTEETIKDNHFACTPDEFELLVKLGTQIAKITHG